MNAKENLNPVLGEASKKSIMSIRLCLNHLKIQLYLYGSIIMGDSYKFGFLM